jgi:hypothetical protein
VALLIAFAALALARGVALPLAMANADARCFASVDEAAIEALKVAMLLPAAVEHGGAIYDRNGCFVFSAPVTNEKAMAVLFRVRISASSRLAGIYHTHTRASGPSDQFSVVDILQARSSRVPSYIGVHGVNHIRKLDEQHSALASLTFAERSVLRHSVVRGVVLAVLSQAGPMPLTPG